MSDYDAKIAKENASYGYGKADGHHAAFLKNPPHREWERDRNGRLTHFNKPYLSGYKVGYKEATGIDLY